jgi:hypothetical protein
VAISHKKNWVQVLKLANAYFRGIGYKTGIKMR